MIEHLASGNSVVPQGTKHVPVVNPPQADGDIGLDPLWEVVIIVQCILSVHTPDSEAAKLVSTGRFSVAGHSCQHVTGY